MVRTNFQRTSFIIYYFRNHRFIASEMIISYFLPFSNINFFNANIVSFTCDFIFFNCVCIEFCQTFVLFWCSMEILKLNNKKLKKIIIKSSYRDTSRLPARIRCDKMQCHIILKLLLFMNCDHTLLITMACLFKMGHYLKQPELESDWSVSSNFQNLLKESVIKSSLEHRLA